MTLILQAISHATNVSDSFKILAFSRNAAMFISTTISGQKFVCTFHLPYRFSSQF
jgi:hypothetical protein